MGFFDMLFGKKKEGPDLKGMAYQQLKDEIKQELTAEIVKENEALREDLSNELQKMHGKIYEFTQMDINYDDKIRDLRQSLAEINSKIEDLAIMGRLALENKDRIERVSHACATKNDIETLRHEILNVSKVDHIPSDEEVYEEKLETEPRGSLAQILSGMPQSRRALINILLEAESPISYKQIANTMGLAYNTIKVYVRDIREAGFPVEEYMVQNKKLLNIPNSVKASLLYGQR